MYAESVCNKFFVTRRWRRRRRWW